MSLLKVLAEETSEQKIEAVIDSLYELTSDRGQLSKEELERKAVNWLALLGSRIFDKYLRYTIRACCLSRLWRGPVTADEFLRVSVRIRNGEVWSIQDREWIPEIQAMETIINSQSSMADRYRAAEDAGDTETTDRILAECRAIIYGWEE